MSIQNLSDQQELLKIWDGFKNLKGSYDSIILQLGGQIAALEINEKYNELASKEEKDLVSLYKGYV